MIQTIFVTGLEAASGKFLVSLALLDLFQRKKKQIAFFKPLVARKKQHDHIHTAANCFRLPFNYAAMAGLTGDNLSYGMETELKTELTGVLVEKLENLKNSADMTIIEGTDYTDEGRVFEFDVNLQLARNLAAAVVIVIDGSCRTIRQITESVRAATANFNSRNIAVLAVVVNKLEAASMRQLPGLKDAFPRELIIGLPETTGLHGGLNTPRKVTAAIGMFNRYADVREIEQRLDTLQNPGLTFAQFQYRLIRQARKYKASIVVPESGDERVLKAVIKLREGELADIILLGDEHKITERLKVVTPDFDTAKIRIVNPAYDKRMDVYVRTFCRLRKDENITSDDARQLLRDYCYFGTMMVYAGDADAMVAGAVFTTQQAIRPALEIIKTKKGKSLVSSVFFMCLPDRVVLFGDCAVNPDPTANQLAEIAISSAETAARFGIEPRVAMISYSTGASGKGRAVDKVSRATAIIRRKRPELLIEGPVQYDAAVNPAIAAIKLPGSKVAGRATVLIFPDLNSGNSIYKAVQQETGAVAIGPVLQDLDKPVNDMSRGATVSDIFDTLLVTAIQCQQTPRAADKPKSGRPTPASIAAR